MANLSVRLLMLVGVVVLAVAALTRPDPAAAATKRATVLAEIAELRSETWHWQRLMMKPRTPTNYGERTSAPSSAPRTRPTSGSGAASTGTSVTRARAGARAPATASTAACR